MRGVESPRLQELGAYVVVMEMDVMNTKSYLFELQDIRISVATLGSLSFESEGFIDFVISFIK